MIIMILMFTVRMIMSVMSRILIYLLLFRHPKATT